MGSITALAPPVRSGSYLAKPKPTGPMLLQSLIDSIEGLRHELALRSSSPPPVRYQPPDGELVETLEPVEIRQVQAAKPPGRTLTVQRSKLVEFFD